MAQTGYTPIQLYYSSTASAVPLAANLAAGELAINTTDGKLYYKSNAGVVTLIAGSTSGPAGGSNTQVQYNSSGVLAGSASLTWNGTVLTSSGFAGPLNGTVGATTPNTGAFTTTTIGTSETLSYGTANGVAYLNGSKVVTTGSALTFDGSNFKLTGADNANLIWSVNSNAGAQSLRIQANVAGLYLQGAGTVDPLYITQSSATGYIVFRPASDTEGMRLTSTSLLVGASSDALGGNKLLVQSASTANNNRTMSVYNTAATSTTAFANRILQLSSSGSGADVTLHFSDQVANNAYIGMGSGALYFAIGSGTTKNMVLDASGNLGLGVTPSAQNIGSSFELKGGASLSGGVYPSMYLTSNAVYNSSWTYKQNGFATFYLQQSGQHQWQTAPSGTAGNAITFTQAMTLDASGNLAVGTTNTAYGKVNIKASGPYVYSGLTLFSNDGTESFMGLGCTSSVAGIFVTYGASGSYLPFTISTGGSERARIDSSGNFGIGTTSPSVLLNVSSPSQDGGKILIQSGTLSNGNRATLFMSSINVNGQTGNVSIECNHPNNQQSDMVFRTGATDASSFGTERMRLNTSGNLGINTIPDDTGSPRAKISAYQDSAYAVTNFSGPGGNQGTPCWITVVRQLSVVSLGTKIYIPFVNQGSINNNTIVRIRGISAQYNTNGPKPFVCEFAVGHLGVLYNLTSWGLTTGVTSVGSSGMTVIINLSDTYTYSTSNGVFMVLEYLSSFPTLSIDVPNIAMN